MKTNLFKIIFFSILIILVVLSVYIMYFESKDVKTKTNENPVNLNINKNVIMGITNFDTINPLLSHNRDIQYIDKLIFDSLLDITYDFKIENSLAKEFSKINSLTYIAKLKEDVYWHDGTKFNADDVTFTINNLKKESINSIYKENVKYIEEVQKIDEYTIKIILNKEIPFFEYMMCFPIVSKNSYNENTLEAKTKYPIGTGEYRISYINENEIELENNKQKIKIIVKDSIRSLYNAFNKNEIDLMITDNLEYEEYLGTMGYNTNMCSNRYLLYLVLNNNNKFLKEKWVRQAIGYAIDKNAINYIVFKNKYNVANFPLEYGSYLFSKEDNSYDINKAKSLLINNSLKKQDDKLRFSLVINNTNKKEVLVAEEIKKELEEIGIIIVIEKVDDSSYNNYIKNKNYDMILVRKYCIK